MVEMFSGNTQKVNPEVNGDQKGKRKVFDDGDNSSNGSLESGVENPKLASQEIQGPATPANIHGNFVAFETVEGKEGEEPKTDQLQQSHNQKIPVHLFTTSVKPRLRWTTKLHARFIDAINKLGGPQKATPKTLQDAMGLEGLGLRHVKSHLQKYRMGKLRVRDWPEMPKIRALVSQLSTGPSNGTSSCKLPSQANGRGKYKRRKVKETYKSENKSQGQGQLYMKLKEMSQDAEYQTNSNDLIQDAQKKLADQCNNVGTDANAGAMFHQDLAGEKTTAITPFHSIPEKKFPKYDTLDKIKGCIGFQKQVSISSTYQPPNVAHSMTGDFITSQGYLCKAYDAANAINMHAGPQEVTPSFLSQNEAYTSLPPSGSFDFHPQSSAHEFYPQKISSSPSNGFPTSIGNHSENIEYLRDFQPPIASYTFHSQNAFNDYQPQNAYYPFQLQNTSYNYQPQSSAYINQFQNAASSGTNNFPSNVNYSDTAYLDDLTAALAMIGSVNIATLLDDPVDTYMVWDSPEPKAKDNGNNGHTM